MAYPRGPVKLVDLSGEPSRPTELILVEGDSAARAVIRLRDPTFQAVLPMQGKPLNAWKASRNAVTKNPWMQAAIESLIGISPSGFGNRVTGSHVMGGNVAGKDGTIADGLADDFRIGDVRYDRILFMFDPDADGIHCGALMLMFFYRWMRPLLESGRILAARPPLYEIRSVSGDDVLHGFTDEHYRQLKSALDAKQIKYQSRRYRGLAAMGERTLTQTCLDPETRQVMVMGVDDAKAAIEVFCGQSPS